VITQTLCYLCYSSLVSALHPALPLRGLSIPKISDLPKLKSFGIDGVVATWFLLSLKDLCDDCTWCKSNKSSKVNENEVMSAPSMPKPLNFGKSLIFGIEEP
jgi:hypothetical protein